MYHDAADCAHPKCRAHVAGERAGEYGTHSTLIPRCLNSLGGFHDLVPLKPDVESMLDEAKKLVRGDRQRDYQPPAVNFDRIIRGWSVIFGQEVTVEQMTLAMIWLKIAREVGTPKRDNWVDIAGYVEAYDWAKQEMDDGSE